jgi:choline dehydrogenase-like flavoprotein
MRLQSKNIEICHKTTLCRCLKKQDGVGYFQRAIKNGRRVSSARAFLHPAMGRPNLQVFTHAHATKILFEGKRAVGIEWTCPDFVPVSFERYY